MTERDEERVVNAKVDDYRVVLTEYGRPPSRGGNGRAWHVHIMTINGERYSFRALGRKQWVFAADTVSFAWRWNETKKYRNVVDGSLSTADRNGRPVVRGIRGWKPQRTAETRMPVSSREWRD